MTFFKRKPHPKTDIPDARVEKLISAAAYPATAPRAEFRDALLSHLFSEREQIHHSPPSASKQKKSFVSNFRLPTITMPAIAAVLIVMFAIVLFSAPDDRSDSTKTLHPILVTQTVDPADLDSLFELTAADQSDAGIAPTTAFILKTKFQTTIDAIKETLNFTPQVAYAIEETDENTYRITFDTPLEAGTIVVASLEAQLKTESGETVEHTYSWSYQVQEMFQVISTLPRDKTTHVPLDTGIEITFSHNDVSGVSEQFSITPAVKGRFETHRKTVVFIPETPLQPETVYTVMLKKQTSLPSTNETLQKDLVFSFETDQPETKKDFYTSRVSIRQTSTQDAPSVMINGRSFEHLTSAKMSIYRYPSAESYQHDFDTVIAIPEWSYFADRHIVFSKNDLQLQSTTTVSLQDIGDYYQRAMYAPTPLSAGYYLIEINEINSTPLYSLVQVSDITAYVTTSATDFVLWSHNATTTQSIEDAVVTLQDGMVLGSTDAKGLLRVPMPEQIRHGKVDHASIRITKESESLLLPFIAASSSSSEYFYDDRDANNFWAYIYLDQPLYKPDDTVNFWGVAEARYEQAPSTATVAIFNTNDFFHEDNKSPYYMQTVPIDEFGTFQGSIDLKNIRPGEYYLTVTANSETISRHWFTVLDYVKPAYMLEITPENTGVIYGEPITHTVTARTFDGTPVAGTEISVGSRTGVTDSNGHVDFQNVYDDRQQRAYKQSFHVSAHPTFSEEAEISADARLTVFPSSQLLHLEARANEETASLTGTLYELDLNAYTSGAVDFYNEPYGTPIINHDVEVTITRTWYTTTQNGTRYDFINKKSVPLYSYEQHSEEVQTEKLRTNDDGNFSYQFEVQPASSYKIECSSTDNTGRKMTTTTSVYSRSFFAREYHGDRFNLYFERKDVIRSEYSSDSGFSLGEEVNIAFYHNEEVQKTADEFDFLFIKSQNGIRDVVPQKDPQYRFTFSEYDIPNVHVQGVWFDGHTYWNTYPSESYLASNGVTASFDEKERDIAITVQLDKKEYRPGDVVTMDISAVRADGATAVTMVNVNLIDEAVYAIRDEDQFHKIDFNRTLYEDAVSGIFTSYASHRYPLYLDLSGGGGGGGDHVRRNFPDKALFKTVRTDSNGKAELSFTLPDNLTSWRITTHAIDRDRYAGSNTTKLTVTQPFLVNAVLGNEYLMNDQPVMKLRALGTELHAEDPVQFIVSSETLDMAETAYSTNGSEAISIPLPPLHEGTQKVVIRASAGELSDAIERSFTVVSSRLVTNEFEIDDVVNGWAPGIDTDRNFDITFTDKQIGQFYPYLTQYLCACGDRLDQKVSRAIAAQLLRQYFSQETLSETINPSVYQVDSGGLALLPYSDADLALTVQIAASTLADQFNAGEMAKYFNAILNDESQTTDRHAMSVYGLAALHQPVLLEISAVLKSDAITDADRLYLAAALAAIGDYHNARILFDALNSTFGKTADQYRYIEFVDSKDDMLQQTLQMAVIAAIIQHPDADALFNYAIHQSTQDILLNMLAINFISARLPHLPQSPVRITYQHLGEEKTIELKHGSTQTIPLTAETAREFMVNTITGTAQAIIHYTRTATTEELTSNEGISVTRSFDRTNIIEGDLVKVTLSVRFPQNAPDDTYQVTDYIPSGMRIVTAPYRYDSYSRDKNAIERSPYLIDGQRASFVISKRNPRFTYYLRVLNAGIYTAESPVVQSFQAPSVRGVGASERVVITASEK